MGRGEANRAESSGILSKEAVMDPQSRWLVITWELRETLKWET
jgi:hypothetical protein